MTQRTDKQVPTVVEQVIHNSCGVAKMRNRNLIIQLFAFILAVLVFSGQLQAETYYFHNDQLGTPQVVTDNAQQVVWKGEYDPFGKVTETTSQVQQNLRFPGQYYDQETGLHYNYFRTYDPKSGRYVESDPIGIVGGLNTYGYSKQSPVVYVDPDGLFIRRFITGKYGIYRFAKEPGRFIRDVFDQPSPVVPFPTTPWEIDDVPPLPIVIDPNQPLPPQLPDYVDPSVYTSGVEAESCPVPNGPSLDPRERCFNGVILKYAACVSSGRNPVLCSVNRAIGYLACAAQKPTDD